MPVISREWGWDEGPEGWECNAPMPEHMRWEWEGDPGPPPSGVAILASDGTVCHAWWGLRDVTWADILPTLPAGSKIKTVRLASCRVVCDRGFDDPGGGGTLPEPEPVLDGHCRAGAQIYSILDEPPGEAGEPIWTTGAQPLMMWDPFPPTSLPDPDIGWEMAEGAEWLPVHPKYAALDTRIMICIYAEIIEIMVRGSVTAAWDNFKLDIIYEEPEGGGGGDDGGGDVGEEPPYDEYVPVWPREDLVYDCDEPGYQEGAIVHHMLGWSRLWSSEQRLYVSYGGRTLAYDTVTRGWTDAGYGSVKAALNVMDGRHPESMWMLLNGGRSSEIPTEANLPAEYANAIWVAHRALNNNDPMTGALYARRAVLGPYDGDRDARGRNKRAIRLRVWGSVTDIGINQSVQSVGTLVFKNESGYRETYPIIPRRFSDGGMPDTPATIVDQMFTPAMIGRVLFADMTFTAKCVSITESELEYVVLS